MSPPQVPTSPDQQLHPHSHLSPQSSPCPHHSSPTPGSLTWSLVCPPGSPALGPHPQVSVPRSPVGCQLPRSCTRVTSLGPPRVLCVPWGPTSYSCYSQGPLPVSPGPHFLVTSSLGSPAPLAAIPKVPSLGPHQTPPRVPPSPQVSPSGVPCRPGAPRCSPVARCSARQAARSAGQDAAAMGTRGTRGAPVVGEGGAGLPPPAPRPCPQPPPQCPASRTAPVTALSPRRGPLSRGPVPVSSSLSPCPRPSPGTPALPPLWGPLPRGLSCLGVSARVTHPGRPARGPQDPRVLSLSPVHVPRVSLSLSPPEGPTSRCQAGTAHCGTVVSPSCPPRALPAPPSRIPLVSPPHAPRPTL